MCVSGFDSTGNQMSTAKHYGKQKKHSTETLICQNGICSIVILENGITSRSLALFEVIHSFVFPHQHITSQESILFRFVFSKEFLIDVLCFSKFRNFNVHLGGGSFR